MFAEAKPPPRIGIALSGGSLKAAAHVGVLAALSELGIHPSCIAGTSAGAFVAALYAHGYSHDDLLDVIRRFPGASLFDYGFPLCSSLWSLWQYKWPWRKQHSSLHMPNGLIRGKRLESYFRTHLAHRETTIPYFIIATDLLSGLPVVYSNDPASITNGNANPVQDVAKVILGSCCLPGIMTPVPIGPKLLVDGAFRHYVPVDVLRRAGCSKIIAVNLYRLQPEWQPETFAHILARSFEILLQESIEDDIDGSDTMVIQPDVGHLSWVSFEKMETCVQIGRESVTAQAPKLEAMLRAPGTSAESLSKPHIRIKGRKE